jgi:hypothetical protein
MSYSCRICKHKIPPDDPRSLCHYFLMAGQGLKAMIVAAGALAVGAFIFYHQYGEIGRARAQNEQLRAQLQAAEQQAAEAATRPAAMATNTPAGPDPELLRLRAEVTRLRALEGELARARQQLAQTKATVAAAPVQPAPAPDPAVAAQYQEQVARTANAMKQLGLGLIMLAQDQTAVDKSVIQNGQVNPKLAQALTTAENPAGIDLNNIEFVVTDAGQLNAAPAPVLARTKPIPTPDGKWLRVYAVGDGSAQQRLHQSPDEVWDGR